ncbi:glycine--tRNA ligase [Patescibacteria group bacterium]|nr:glycine--tRNA ligase [Patescibacteria group bacterium]MBU4116017.1 glycine--tRNA ligase [Patescibacteria group bacterium]
MENSGSKLDKIISLAKRRGFIYQGSEIYGGLAGTWDYGPLGVELKNNIKNLWWSRFVRNRGDIFGLDAAILMNQGVWEASGHTDGFSDPLAECGKCKKRYKIDELKEKKCPECGGELGEEKQFNMMFKTNVGAVENKNSISYLRPETAQGIFVNFKNIIDSFHPQLPFGIAQIGKAFRNEIAPRDFIFRTREFEQMEIEYFVYEKKWKKSFEEWVKEMREWINEIGLNKKNVHEHEVPKEELAHYSKRTIDFEYDYPFGRSELYGLAYRTDFDLKNHTANSNVPLEYYDQEKNEKIVPHVIEPSLGVDRTILALLCDSYTEEDVNGEVRALFKFKKEIAPIKIAVLPLSKKSELQKISKKIFENLKNKWICMYDETQSIGKRYRRQDEIGTPYCVTIDFESVNDKKVTVRERDSMKQDRIPISDLKEYFNQKL